MHLVRGPHEVHLVAKAVYPVIAEVIGQQRAHPYPPVGRGQFEGVVTLVNRRVDGRDHQTGQRTLHLTEVTEVDTRECVGQRVATRASPVRIERFYGDGQQKYRKGQGDRADVHPEFPRKWLLRSVPVKPWAGNHHRSRSARLWHAFGKPLWATDAVSCSIQVFDR